MSKILRRGDEVSDEEYDNTTEAPEIETETPK